MVDRLGRSLGRAVKIGHAGTLDPLAVGVLVLCVGKATRLIEYVQRSPKCYTAAFLLGRSSPSDDIETDVTELPNAPRPSRAEIAAAAVRLTGVIEQRPPAFSAVKLAGRRAYELARRGENVELRTRAVEVHAIEILDYDYPRLVLRIQCGSGTYIRALGRDLATALGTAAVMAELVRTAVGPFRVDDAVPPEAIDVANWPALLLPAIRAVDSMPRIVLSASQQQDLRHGRPPAREAGLPQAPEYAAVDEAGNLLAILKPVGRVALAVAKNLVGQG